MKKKKIKSSFSRTFDGKQIMEGVKKGIVHPDVLRGRIGTFNERISLEQYLQDKEKTR